MNNIQIGDTFDGFPSFLGVFARNRLPRIKTLPCALVLNTDAKGQPGEHWVCIFINRSGVLEYFDPFGLPPLHPDITNFIMKNSKQKHYFYNAKCIQNPVSQYCGNYCIDFIRARFNHVSMLKYINKYSNDLTKNDNIIKKKKI